MLHLARTILALVAALPLLTVPVRAGEADVIAAKVVKTGATYAFEVTIKSNDTGWDYYADAFEVLSPDGTVLGTRVLLHPHDDEQPFTRDLTDVAIPAGITTVTIRARHKPAGYNGTTLKVELPR
jgi:hypothetical protein